MDSSIEQVFEACKPRGAAEIVVRQRCSLPVETVWGLLATPGAWPRWTPHLRAQGDAGSQPAQVEEGMSLIVRGPGGVRLDAIVTLVHPGARWDFVVQLPGPWAVSAAHAVRQWGAGCDVGVRLRLSQPVPGVVGRAFLLGCAPLASRALTRLTRVAADTA